MVLSALLSKVIVAYTIEADNEFERRLVERGHKEQLSVVAWLNFLQYLGPERTQVKDVMAKTNSTRNEVASVVGCLERWGFVTAALRPGDAARAVLRDGWGTGKGIRDSSLIEPSPKGGVAIGFWPEVIATIDKRWQQRFTDQLPALQQALKEMVDRVDIALPDGVPSGWMKSDWRRYRVRGDSALREGALIVQLSRGLQALSIAYEKQSTLPLELAANTLRVLTTDGTPLARLPMLSGISSQTTGPQCTVLAKSGLALVDKVGRGKVLKATEAGVKAQHDYQRISENVESDKALSPLYSMARDALAAILTVTHNGDLAIREALRPPSGTRRAGAASPALGRVEVAPGARARNKELVAQTEAFVADPLGALPHYPVWDGNRGFGP